MALAEVQTWLTARLQTAGELLRAGRMSEIEFRRAEADESLSQYSGPLRLICGVKLPEDEVFRKRLLVGQERRQR